MIIVGGNSMIGSQFIEFNKNQIANLVKLNYPEFDLILEKEDKIISQLEKFEDEVLVHFAAFTDVEGAQIQRGDLAGSCWQLNVVGTAKLVKACQKLNFKMVFISTDFVFDGAAGPYSEDDRVAKTETDISWYAWTKLVGEQVVRNGLEHFLIARTSYPYRAKYDPKLDFVRNIIKRLSENTLYPIFQDQFLTPTFVDNFVKALNLLISENQTGVWHVVDNSTLSAYQAACEIAKVFDFNPNLIKKTSLANFQKKNPKAAIRPLKGGLKNDKLRKFLENKNFSMQNFGQALGTMKQQMEVKVG